jgi:ubiquinone/menaquinone biosynthesis C-methylase UbiE
MKTMNRITGEEKPSISTEASKVYEEFFVPALLAEWAPVMAKAVEMKYGERILDVACGTGVLARYMKKNYNADVTGVDISKEMLSVASEKTRDIQWVESPAESLPFENDSFDAVTCQFGLMFFNNREGALQEMNRVLKPGRKVSVSVWDTIENSPGYLTLYELLRQEFGDDVSGQLLHPFALGDKALLKEIFRTVGFKSFEIETKKRSAIFPSVRSWIHTEIRGWVFSDMINDEQLYEFTEKAEKEVKRYADESGKVRFDIQAHIITAVKVN